MSAPSKRESLFQRFAWWVYSITERDVMCFFLGMVFMFLLAVAIPLILECCDVWRLL